MGDGWDVPNLFRPSVFHTPLPTQRCEGELVQECGICKALPHDSSIHPVYVYRVWNTEVPERGHRAAPWLMVEPFLEVHGYRLKKLQGDWRSPSADHEELLLFSELEYGPFSFHTYPAIDKNGRDVFVKVVPLYDPHSQEYEIWRLLDTERMRSDPRNRTIPVREILFFAPDFTPAGFTPMKTDTKALIIMEKFPPLHDPDPSNELLELPRVRSFDDLLSLATDLLECLEFLFEHGIFHRDLADTNIVYNLKRKCWMLIDFEMSEHYPRPWTEPLRVLPSSAEREPEVGLGVPYDPYLSEAYGAGVILWRAYNFSHLEGAGDTFGLSDVWDSMMDFDPSKRTTIKEALQRAQAIKNNIAHS